MARVFAVRAEVGLAIQVSGYKLFEGCEVVMMIQNCLGGKAQCRGSDCLEGRKLFWLQDFDCLQ